VTRDIHINNNNNNNNKLLQALRKGINFLVGEEHRIILQTMLFNSLYINLQ